MVTREEYDALILSALSERSFQAQVRRTLEGLGWKVFVIPNMKKTLKGWPDLFAIHPRHPFALSWELKKEDGKATPHQLEVCEIMARVPGIDARIMRPSEWPAVRDALMEGRLFDA